MDGFYRVHKQVPEIREIDRFLSKRLARVREVKGVLPDLMASELAISIDLLGEYETGTRKIPATTLCRMSQVLCVKLSYVFSDSSLDRTAASEAD